MLASPTVAPEGKISSKDGLIPITEHDNIDWRVFAKVAATHFHLTQHPSVYALANKETRRRLSHNVNLLRARNKLTDWVKYALAVPLVMVMPLIYAHTLMEMPCEEDNMIMRVVATMANTQLVGKVTLMPTPKTRTHRNIDRYRPDPSRAQPYVSFRPSLLRVFHCTQPWPSPQRPARRRSSYARGRACCWVP